MKLWKKVILYSITALLTFTVGNNVVMAEEVDSLNHKNGKHYTCIHFVDEYSGKEVRNSCAPQGTSGTKSYTHKTTEQSNQGNVYKLIGWYDAEGNQVSDNATIKASYTSSNEKCEDIYYYLKWQEFKAPVLHFNYIDKVSTGTGSWSNDNGNTSTYTHTFVKPEDQDHFLFMHWIIDNTIYNPTDSFTYDFSDKEFNNVDDITAYACWQSSVTLNLYDEDKLLKTSEDFEKVSIDGYEPEKEGYKFVEWVDEEDNSVTEDTFYPFEASIEKINPRVVNLFAVWKDNKTGDVEPTVIPAQITNIVYPTTVVPPTTGI